MQGTLFNLGFTALAGILIAESVMLHSLLERALSFRRGTIPGPPNDPLSGLIGTLLPAFSARLLNSDLLVSDEIVKSNTSMLFFVQLSDISAWTPEVLRSLIVSMWVKVDGPLYVVGMGSEAECRQLEVELLLTSVTRDNVSILVDDQRLMATSLGVTTTPCSVMFEPGGRIVKVGTPSKYSGDDPAATVQRG